MSNKINTTIDGLEFVNDAGRRVVIRTNHGAESDQYIDLPTSGGVLSTGGGADGNDLVKVSSNDTTAGYLNGKLVAGSGVTFTEGNDGGNETLTIAAGGGIDTIITEPGFTAITSHTTPATIASITGLELNTYYQITCGCYLDANSDTGYQDTRLSFTDNADASLPYPKGWAAAYNTSFGVTSPDAVEIHNYIAGSSHATASGTGFNFYYDAQYSAAFPFFRWIYKPTTSDQQTIKFKGLRVSTGGTVYVSEVVLSATKLVTA